MRRSGVDEDDVSRTKAQAGTAPNNTVQYSTVVPSLDTYSMYL